MDIIKKQNLITYFEQFVSPNKRAKMDQILDNRTRHIAVVLEDVYQAHNASAVVRSCDGFGVQDIHVISQKNQFNVHEGIALGSGKWVSVKQYSRQGANNTKECFDQLKAQGYTVVATTPHEKSSELHELPLDGKVAVVFGNEEQGLSNEAFSNADAFVTIPMHGFIESFNLSVSVAICLYDLTLRLRRSSIDWKLTEDEKIDVLLEWMRGALGKDKAALLEQRYEQEKSRT